MSLEKAIFYKKEKRQPYRDSRRFDWTCRNHGKCDYCKNGRLHNSKIKKFYSEQEIKEWKSQIE
jgi:hypothetical protein